MLRPFATKLDEKTIDVLDGLAHKTQVPKSRLVAKAIHLLAEQYGQDQTAPFVHSASDQT